MVIYFVNQVRMRVSGFFFSFSNSQSAETFGIYPSDVDESGLTSTDADDSHSEYGDESDDDEFVVRAGKQKQTDSSAEEGYARFLFYLSFYTICFGFVFIC
jgi:hypothetical protein